MVVHYNIYSVWSLNQESSMHKCTAKYVQDKNDKKTLKTVTRVSRSKAIFRSEDIDIYLQTWRDSAICLITHRVKNKNLQRLTSYPNLFLKLKELSMIHYACILHTVTFIIRKLQYFELISLSSLCCFIFQGNIALPCFFVACP